MNPTVTSKEEIIAVCQKIAKSGDWKQSVYARLPQNVAWQLVPSTIIFPLNQNFSVRRLRISGKIFSTCLQASVLFRFL